MTAAIISTLGLICDIVGVLLVANEVVRVFHGPTTVDVGSAGKGDGEFVPAVNPKYAKHETTKRHLMKVGLGFLILGFVLQGVAVWWAFVHAT